MAYIYMITNDINNKQYIGKTEFSIEKRFKKHLQDATRPQMGERPLYKAINKYGPEHFSVKLIEETDCPEEREQFWIEYYGTFHNGYNATLGGDGRKYIDYDLVVKTYQEVQNCIKTAEILNINVDSVHKILKIKNCQVLSSQEINRQKLSKTIGMFDIQGKLLQVFPSTQAAGKYLIENNIAHSNSKMGYKGAASHITHVCQNKRKTAYGFKWKYI